MKYGTCRQMWRATRFGLFPCPLENAQCASLGLALPSALLWFCVSPSVKHSRTLPNVCRHGFQLGKRIQLLFWRVARTGCTPAAHDFTYSRQEISAFLGPPSHHL